MKTSVLQAKNFGPKVFVIGSSVVVTYYWPPVPIVDHPYKLHQQISRILRESFSLTKMPAQLIASSLSHFLRTETSLASNTTPKPILCPYLKVTFALHITN